MAIYKTLFGLTKFPFSMTPDPGMLFFTQQHREAVVALTFSIMSRKGFIVMIGEAGTGKTTVLNKALTFIPQRDLSLSVILNPTLTPSEFLEMALLDFGITDISASKAQRLARLNELLDANKRQGRLSVLIVDEAHTLAPAVLEEIRLLSNFERADEKLLQIVLLGQPELATLLNREDLRQLKQRVAIRLSVVPLAADEVAEYVRCRWQRAGAQKPLPFDAESLAEVAAASRGIPRLVNAICDNALTLAVAQGNRVVTRQNVIEASSDLDIRERRSLTNGAATIAPPKPEPIRKEEPESANPYEFTSLPTLTRYAEENGGARAGLFGRWTHRLGFSK